MHIQSYLKKQPKSNSIQFKYLTVYTSKHIYELIFTGLDDRDLLEELQIICSVTNYEDAIEKVEEFIKEVYERTDYYYNKFVEEWNRKNNEDTTVVINSKKTTHTITDKEQKEQKEIMDMLGLNNT